MITRRITQILLATTLALASVFGIAGIASAAFTSTTASTQLSVSTVAVASPTNLKGTCNLTFLGFGRQPTVSFVPSQSYVARPTGSATSAAVYRTSITSDGGTTPDPQLDSSATGWSGATRYFSSTQKWVFTITATYGNWTSGSTTVKFDC